MPQNEFVAYLIISALFGYGLALVKGIRQTKKALDQMTKWVIEDREEGRD